MMKKIKLVVFDMEGTIFKKTYRLMDGRFFPSTWAALCECCGMDAKAEDSANRNRHEREGHIPGAYPYSQWVIDTIKIHQKYGLTRELFEAVIQSVEYFDGVKEAFDTLKGHGIQIAIISGGLKAQVDRVALEHRIEHCFGAAEYFWGDDGRIVHWNVMPTDFEHKQTILEILCRDLGVDRSECAFIGDGRNDIHIAGYAALGIGFNPHQELRNSAMIIIEQEQGKENLADAIEPIVKYPFFSREDFASGKTWKVKSIRNTEKSNDPI